MTTTSKTRMTPKGKSPIDRKKTPFNEGAHHNSVQARVQRGDFVLPGKTKEETIALFKKWQKNNQYDSNAMERWFHSQVREEN